MPLKYQNMTPEQKKKNHAKNKKWKQKNPEKAAQYKHTHYMNNRERYLKIERERSYKKLYGILIADYDRMFKEQNGLCAICLVDKPTQNKNIKRIFFSIDHCHKTGKVRGLLCSRCNSQLGWYEKYAKEICNYLK